MLFRDVLMASATCGGGSWSLLPIYAQGAAHLDPSDASKVFTTNAAAVNVSADGDPVGYLADKSGNAYHYSVADANRPTFKTNIQNGRSVIRLDGTDDYLTGLKAGLTRNKGAVHVIAVLDFRSMSSASAIFFSVGTSGNTRAGLSNIGGVVSGISRRGDASASTNRNAASSPAGFFIAHVFHDFTNGHLSIYQNGALVGAAKLTSPGLSADTDEQAIRLGTADLAAFLNGDLGEMLFIPAAVGAGDMQHIYAYLAERWGLTVETPVMFDPTGDMRTAWTWFNDPRVLALSSTHFVIGGINRAGDLLIADLNNGVMDQSVVASVYQLDDHNNPGFALRSDNKILAIASKHISGTYERAISTNANDGSEWPALTNIDSQLAQNLYSYANLFKLDSGRIYDFHRATNSVTSDIAWHYTYSDDDGATFVNSVQMSDDQRPYHKFRKNGSNRIDIIRNDGHPFNKATNSIYHYYLQDDAGSISFKKSDGTATGALPLEPADITLVYDGTAARSWVHDVVPDGLGNPVAAFAVFPDATDLSAPDHRYYQARWDGSDWTNEEICAAGGGLYPQSDDGSETFYSGGVITDPEDVDIVYCSRQVNAAGAIDNSDAGIHQIFKAERVSEGIWTLTQLTFGSDKCFRPYLPEGSRTLFYLTGRYTSYLNYDTRVAWLGVDA